jgi:hypothetical protein
VSARLDECRTPTTDRSANTMRATRMGIDAGPETIVFLREDNPVCRAEGFLAHARIELSCCGRSVIATLNHAHGALLRPGEMGLSDSAWRRLGVAEGDEVAVSTPVTGRDAVIAGSLNDPDPKLAPLTSDSRERRKRWNRRALLALRSMPACFLCGTGAFPGGSSSDCPTRSAASTPRSLHASELRGAKGEVGGWSMNARPAAVEFEQAMLGLIAVYGTPLLVPTARTR